MSSPKNPVLERGSIVLLLLLLLCNTQAQPSECGRQHTLISVHAQTAAWQQSNGNSEARMSEKCGEWRD